MSTTRSDQRIALSSPRVDMNPGEARPDDDLVDYVSAGAVIWDTEDRFVRATRAARQLLLFMEDQLVPGLSASDLFRTAFAHANPAAMPSEIDQWVEDSVRRHHELKDGPSLLLPDETELLVKRYRLPEGGTLSVWHDVSDLRGAENERDRLGDIIENMGDRVAYYDSDDRLVFCNDAYRREFAALGELLRPGTRREDIARRALELGLVRGGEGTEPEDWLRQNLLTHREKTGGVESQGADGRWSLVSRYATADGGTFIVRHDITELKEAQAARSQFADAFDSLSIGALLYDSEGNLVTANKAIHAEYDGNSDLLEPGTPRSRVLDGLSERGLIPTARARKGDKSISRETTVAQAPDGRWFQISSIPIADGGVFVLREDITARKEVEGAAQQNLAAMSAVLNAVTDRAMLLDDRGAILAVNHAHAQSVGLSPEQMIGQVAVDRLPDDIRERRIEQRAEALASGEPSEFEEYVEGRWERHSIYPIKDERGEFSRFALVIRDITDEREFTESLKEAKARAEIADRGKTEFLANMSHELRTPLNAIIGFSDGLVAEIFGPLNNDKQREYLEAIQASGQHLLTLINDILDVSAIETGNIELRESEFRLADLVAAVMTMFQPRAVASALEFQNYVGESDQQVWADETRLKQVVANLLSNAIKFSKVGGEVRITSHLDTHGNCVISISDSGIGMSEDDLEIALSRFGQVGVDPLREREGSGLGLPLSKGLIEAHGGELLISSQPDVGTTANIVLPKARLIGS